MALSLACISAPFPNVLALGASQRLSLSTTRRRIFTFTLAATHCHPPPLIRPPYPTPRYSHLAPHAAVPLCSSNQQHAISGR